MRFDVWGWNRDGTRGDHRAFLNLFEAADALGYGAAWFNEFHFQHPPQPYPSTLLLAAAILARTERLRVGTAVLVLPMHEPHLLAEEIAQLDFQSGGRFDLGLGRGTTPDSFRHIGIDPETTRERFETGYEVLLQTWSQIGTAQRPHPPIYIAGTSRETLGFAAERGLPLLLSLEPGERRQLDLYADILRETGAASAIGASSLARYVVIAGTNAKAAERIDGMLEQLQDRRRQIANSRGLPAAPIDRDWTLANQFVWGDPRQCIEQIAQQRDTIGTNALRCVFNGNGVIDNETAVEAMTLFAREVIPAFA